MKYVMLEVPLNRMGKMYPLSQFNPIIFPNHLVHEDVTKALLEIPQLKAAFPVSAGEVHFGLNGAVCSGYSETLRLKSKKEYDADIINMIDYGGGFR